MHDRRDHYIILLTFIPLVAFVGLYMMWQAAGQPSVMGSDLPFPTISLPDVPNVQTYLPAWLVSGWNALMDRGLVLFAAVGGGIVLGLVGFGFLIDFGKAVWKRVSGRLQAPVALGDEVAEADIL